MAVTKFEAQKKSTNFCDAYIITEKNFLEALPILYPGILDCRFTVKRKTKRGEIPCYYEVIAINDFGVTNTYTFRCGHDIVWIRSSEICNFNSMDWMPKEEFEQKYDTL